MRFRFYAAALLVAWSGAILGAQKVTTTEELDQAMKKIQTAWLAAQKALKSESYADVKTELATVRQIEDDSRGFWEAHKKDDAVKANLDVIAKIDAVDKLLSASPVDPAAVAAALKQVGGGCLSCHKTYRSKDAENNYIIKPGSIGG